MQTISFLQRVFHVLRLPVLFAIGIFLTHVGYTQVSITTFNVAYTEDFGIMAKPPDTAGTIMPAGWQFLESGSGTPNNIYTVGKGNSSIGDTYAFGYVDNGSERALGTLRNSALETIIGASYTNNTGKAIRKITISYTGEYWKCGALSRPDELTFQYSTIATSLNSSGWVTVPGLSFYADSIPGSCRTSLGNKDGNTTCKTFITATIDSLNIPNGTTFWIRWTDVNATGADDGMAVDDFSLTARGDSTPFSFDSTNVRLGVGKIPTQALDVLGNTRTSGKLFIGSVTDDDINNLDSYVLAAKGNALVEKLIVKKYINWPDYVFNNDYKLMPLEALRSYIDANKHLPEIPSARSINANGVDIAVNQSLLLQKIEELTLYILQQQKELESRKETEDTMVKRIAALEKMVSEITIRENSPHQE